MKALYFSIMLGFFSGAATATASAATIHVVDPLGGEIPDGSLGGLSRSLVVDVPNQFITSLSVEVSLSSIIGAPAFLGDLYLYLTDGTTLVTLANRPGRDPSRPDGYDDNQGMQIVFADSAVSDFHVYRESLPGGSSSQLTSMLVGDFQPDGRTTDPLAVASGDDRSVQLSDFAGLSSSRTFTLFAADLSSGAAHRIDRWAINIETIPEPSTGIMLLLALGWLGLSRSRRRR